MGITNFDGLAFTEGLYVGISGQETLIINSSGSFVFPANLSGNVTIGTTSTNTLTVNATSSFLAPISFTSAVGTGSTTSTSFIPTGSTVPTNGMYRSATNTLAFSTNSTNRITLNSSGEFTLSAASATMAYFSRSGSGSAAGIRIQNTDAHWWQGLGATESYELRYNSDSAGTLFFSISSGGLVTIGDGTATTHRLNTLVATGATAGADTLPANPVGFVVININGTARKIPYYAT